MPAFTVIPAATTHPLQSTPAMPHHHRTLLVPGEMPSHADVAPATAAFAASKYASHDHASRRHKTHVRGDRRQSMRLTPAWLAAASNRANPKTAPVNNRHGVTSSPQNGLHPGEHISPDLRYSITAEIHRKNNGWHRPAPESTVSPALR